MTAQTCKRCPLWVKERHWCTLEGVHKSPWQDWCQARRDDWEAWRLEQ